jgi:hypothetical protein
MTPAEWAPEGNTLVALGLLALFALHCGAPILLTWLAAVAYRRWARRMRIEPSPSPPDAPDTSIATVEQLSGKTTL